MSVLQFGTKIDGVDYPDRPGVYALVMRADGLIGCVENKRGFLHLPGGGVDTGESDEQALRREIYEEMVREIDTFHFVGEARQYYHSLVNGNVNKICKYFIVTLTDGFDGHGDRITRWVTFDEFKNKSQTEAHTWALEKWLLHRFAED